VFLQTSLHGNTISLLPLTESDFEPLYNAASDPLIWANHPSPNRYKYEDFCQWFESAIQSNSTLVVRELATGKVIGSSRYYEYDEGLSEVAIGYTFLICSHWGGATNSELKNLMLKHAFQKVETVWFHVDLRNIRSQKAMEKIGAVLSHTAEKSLLGRVEKYRFYKIERKYFIKPAL
ncbi:MAG: GNAT family N-acetyltransferase, partial [Pseudomonadota bacterium]